MPDLVAPKLRRSIPVPTGRGHGDYAELEVTTNFSFLRGASHPDELVYRATELGYRAIAITDFTTLAGVVRGYEAWKETSAKGHAPKFIVGTRLTFNDFPDLLVWATDRASYGRLCRLLTLGKRRAEKGFCLLTLQDFLEHNSGLLAAVANRHEHPFRHPAAELHQSTGGRTYEMLTDLRDALGDRLSLATCRLYGENDSQQTSAIVELSAALNIPLLATNAAYYHDPSRRMLQDVLTCTRHGVAIQQAGYRLFPNGERYLKSPDAMRRLFADLPSAITRGLDIAERCTFSLEELRYEYPVELAPTSTTPSQYLRQLSYLGAIERYSRENVQGAAMPISDGTLTPLQIDDLTRQVPPKILALLDHELALIDQLHYEAYFLTVYDIVRFARSRGILCQGRGSAANSAVCFCLGVTNVDPSRVDVLFERFISAARGEPPDIDVDFEHERREEVLQYIYEKYGREHAGMTAEVITYRGRSAVRDVGKALGLSLDMVDQMARHLEGWSTGTISDDQLREIGMDPANPSIRRVVDITAQVLGFPRHLSQHVGGMIMTRTPLCEMVPIENASMPDRTVIEWDKNDIDALGILKVDCLGLGMLSCLSKAMVLVGSRGTEARRHEGTKGEDGAGKDEASRLPNADSNDSGTSGGCSGQDSNPQGPNCMAAWHEARQADIPLDPSNAARREIRADDADATIVGIGPVEHRGGIREAEHGRLHPISETGEGLPSGTGNASGTGGGSGDAQARPGSHRSPGGSGPSTPRPDPQPSPTPLDAHFPSTPSCLRASVPSCLHLWSIPAEDPAVYDMICKADTVGVFQIESRAQMSMLPRLRPRCFYDLVIEVAIVRPGPIQGNMVHPYLRRRNKEEPVSYPSEALRQVLSKTLGVPLFQEQAMKIAIVGAGFSPDEADQLRRAMAAWRRHGAIERFYQRFIDGMMNNGYTRDFAEYCFMQIRGFGEYGFPESHAASFALLVYSSSWIKLYYPAEFACALINSQPMGFYAPAQIVRDAHNHGVVVLPTDVNHSTSDCTIELHEGQYALRLGYRLIKGLPRSAGDALAAARQRLGQFVSIEQIQRESGLSRKHLKKLAEADAFDSLAHTRRESLWQVMALSDEQYPLFDHVAPSKAEATEALPPMPIGQEVMTDYATTGLSLKRHPVSIVREQLEEMNILSSEQIATLNQDQWVKVAGLVLIRQRPGTASGIIFVTLEDETGITNIIIKPDIYERYRSSARHAQFLEVDGYIERSGEVIHIMAKRLIDLSYLLADLKSTSRDFH